MKTNYYKHILLGFLCLTQVKGIIAQQKHCAATEAMEALYKAHPEMIQEAIEYEKVIQQQIETDKKSGNSRAAETVYIIPVVFHVIHTYGSENISDQQILEAIDILNEDFRKLNADTSSLVSGFDTVAGDARIEFRLAKLDPNGNCTNGIDRIYSHTTNKGNDDAKLNPWPRNKYLNIWTVKTIDPDSHPGAAAYAYFPSNNSYFNTYDGVITSSDYVGKTGTSNASRSRILTHEVGHFLNLYHIWGNTTVATVCGDDAVSDTPVTKGHTSCNLTDQSCTPGVTENTQNFMDYSYCYRMFSKGQIIRMRAALTSSVGQRSSLFAASNLVATGTDGASYTCVPYPDFFASRYNICEGTSILFKQNIINGTPSSNPTWSFQGGTPSTSTALSPLVSYSTAGDYKVTLTATNSAGTDSVVKVDLIHVSGPTADFSGLYSETFETTSNFASWQVNDLDGNSPKAWQLASTGYNSTKSIMMNANGNYAMDIDEFMSPAFDMTNITSPALQFRCAAASKATTAADLDDVLNIYSSNNCGNTWSLRLALQGTSAATGFVHNGYYSGNYVPTSASHWSLKSIPIAAGIATSNVRFKFEYITGNASNNVYIDNINIVSLVGIDEKKLDNSSVSIYPNPTNGSSTVYYHLKQQASSVKITIFNVLGKVISEVNYDNQPEGDYSFLISKQEHNLNNGIYFIKFLVDDNTVTQKLIITE